METKATLKLFMFLTQLCFIINIGQYHDVMMSVAQIVMRCGNSPPSMLTGGLTQDLLFKVAEESDVTEHFLWGGGGTVWLEGSGV